MHKKEIPIQPIDWAVQRDCLLVWKLMMCLQRYGAVLHKCIVLQL